MPQVTQLAVWWQARTLLTALGASDGDPVALLEPTDGELRVRSAAGWRRDARPTVGAAVDDAPGAA